MDQENFPEEFQNFLLTLPKEKGWPSSHLYQYQGYWFEPRLLRAVISAQKNFQAQDTDIILITQPKAGTAWLKALAFAIANRARHSVSDENHPLLKARSHELVPYLELHLYMNPDKLPDMSAFHPPRLFSTHLPYSLLPESIKTSSCRAVCLYRNPFDVFVSFYHFLLPMRPKSLGPLSMEDAFDMYSRGLSPYGPFWDHVLDCWGQSTGSSSNSKENPEKKMLLFLKYEDLKEDIKRETKKLAEFMGFPFTKEEEEEGAVDAIIKMCSFDTLKDLEHNKVGKTEQKFDYKNLYRKGQVGDWVNYFTPSMTETLNKVVDDKLGGSGLEFKVSME